MGIKAPCKGCTQRALHCHSTCEKYQKWCVDNEQAKANKARIATGVVSRDAKVKYHRVKTLRNGRRRYDGSDSNNDDS